MWPATPRIVIGSWMRAGAGLHVAGSSLGAAEQVQQVVGVAGAVAEALLDVGHRGVAVAQRCRVVLGRQGSSTGAGSSMCAERWSGPASAASSAAGWRRRPGRRRRAGCSGPASRSASRRRAGRRSPSGGPVSSPPGAQAASQVASSTLGTRPPRPVPPKQVQPSPGTRVVLLLASRDLVGRDPEQDHVVHDVRVAGQHVAAGQPGVLVQLRVEQEAAVVVGADAGRARTACRARASPASAGVSPSRSGRAFTGSAELPCVPWLSLAELELSVSGSAEACPSCPPGRIRSWQGSPPQRRVPGGRPTSCRPC